jgi:hypothetical protein
MRGRFVRGWRCIAPHLRERAKLALTPPARRCFVEHGVELGRVHRRHLFRDPLAAEPLGNVEERHAPTLQPLSGLLHAPSRLAEASPRPCRRRSSFHSLRRLRPVVPSPATGATCMRPWRPSVLVVANGSKMARNQRCSAPHAVKGAKRSLPKARFGSTSPDYPAWTLSNRRLTSRHREPDRAPTQAASHDHSTGHAA